MRKEKVISMVMLAILISTILSSCLIEDEKEQENGREITIDTIMVLDLYIRTNDTLSALTFQSVLF